MPHRVRPADINEAELKDRAKRNGDGVEQAALALAVAKALEISRSYPEAVVIGADQILDLDGTWFDKPRSMDEARRHLKNLRGKRHRLVNALIAVRGTGVAWQHVEIATLTMRPFADAFLERYLAAAGPEILESVGAYRLEGAGARLFERIDGDYFTILGLPLLALLAFLREAGIWDE